MNVLLTVSGLNGRYVRFATYSFAVSFTNLSPDYKSHFYKQSHIMNALNFA